MRGKGTPLAHCSQPYIHPAAALVLVLLLPLASCKQTPVTQSPPSTKGEKTPQSAPDTAPAQTPARVESVPQGPRYAVQVAAFDRRADAEALASRLSDQYGLQTLVAPVEAGGKTLYRVRLLVQNKEQAESVASTFLRTQNLKVWIVPLP